MPSLRLKCVCDSVVYSYLRYIHNYVAPAAAGSSYDAKCFVHSAQSLPFSLSLSYPSISAASRRPIHRPIKTDVDTGMSESEKERAHESERQGGRETGRSRAHLVLIQG